MRAERAGFPKLNQCRSCHAGVLAPALAEDFPEPPSKRLYRVPDFVFFSHASHAKVACASCHGEVARSDTLSVHRPTTMKACVDCHKEHKATIDCNACHELTQ